MWERWKAGDSLSDIARALGRKPGTVHGFLTDHGGIAPAPRRRGSRGLSLEQREAISRGLASGASLRTLARSLERAPSTISREVRRNGGAMRYRATDAQISARNRARHPGKCRLAQCHELRRLVAQKLRERWSPEQISGWLRQQYKSEVKMQVSHETIYRSLYVQSRGVLKKELLKRLRTRRRMRRSKHATTAGQQRGRIIDAVSIAERPAEVEDRAVPGHWEGDLISGSQNSHIATLVERKSRFTMLVKVDAKDSASVVQILVRQVRMLPRELRQTLTWDRGMELARHKEFSIATDVDVYFCDPQSPWQRGTNENTNRLLREYFPKGTDLSLHTQDDLNLVARSLNERPRKTLGFRTPAAILHEVLH